MSNLLDKASVILTPTAYNNGEALCVKPSDGSGDFDFSRNSAATRVNAQGLVENVQILSSNLVQNPSFSEEGVQEVSNGSFSQEGVEEITNGDFSNGTTGWSSNATLTESNNIANITTTSPATVYIRQNNVYEFGKRYKLTFTAKVDNLTEFELYVGSTNGYISTGIIPTQTTDFQEYNFYFQADSAGGMNLLLRQSMVANSSIEYSEISVREVGQDWVLSGGVSIGSDKAIFNATSQTLLYQNISGTTQGTTYKVTYTISEYISGSIFFGFGNGITSPQGTIRNADGTYTEYITKSDTNISGGFRTNAFIGSITNISVKEVGMDWTLGTGWEIGEDKVFGDGTMGANVLGQNVGFTQGNSYKFSFTIEDYVSGSIYIREPFNGYLDAVNSNGNYSFYYVAGASNQLDFRGNSFVGSITNISVIEITDDTNLPRINYEGFSYQDVLGSEEIVNGTFDDGGANWSNLNNLAVFENSSVIFENNAKIYQSVVSDLTKTYNIEIQFSSISGNGIHLLVGNGNSFVAYSVSDIINNGNKITIEKASFLGTGIMFIYSINSDTIATITNVSVKEYLGQEVVPNSGCGSWLFEPQSTNTILNSNSVSTMNYPSNITKIDNAAISPDGTFNAMGFTPTAVQGIHRSGYSGTSGLYTQNDIVTFSGFVKANGYDFITMGGFFGQEKAVFNISNGTLVSQESNVINTEILKLTNDWYRVSTTYTFQNGIGNGYLYAGIYVMNTETGYAFTGDGVSGVYGYGFQAELGTGTSYIPTSGSTVTRNQDVCNNGGSLATINSTEGTLYFEGVFIGDNYKFISLSDGTSTNRVSIYSNSPTTISFNVKVGGGNQFNGNYAIDTTISHKYVLKYKENDFALWIDGTEVVTDNNGISFAVDTLNEFSFDDGNGGSKLFGKTKAVAVWKEALSDQELADLTYPTPTDPTFTLDFDTIAEQFTFARGSEATYVDAQGLIQSTNELGAELITNGDFATDSNWSKQAGWTISGGTANANMVLGGNGNIYQTVLVVGKTYELTLTVSNYVQGYVRNVTQASPIPLYNSNGTFTEIFVATATNLFLNADTGESTQLSIDNVSVKEVISATNTPRLDYSTGAEAFLLEPQSTNLIPYSSDFSQWSVVNASLNANETISPDGTQNASKLNATSVSSRIQQSLSFSGVNTISIFVKYAGDDVTVRFERNTSNDRCSFDVSSLGVVFNSAETGIIDYKVEEFSNDWYRISCSYDGGSYFQFNGDITGNNGSVYIWGGQAENLSYPTSYIPSNGSQTTRNQETCINATPEINSEEGVLYAEIASLSNEVPSNYISLSDGTYNNRISILYTLGTNVIRAFLRLGGAVQADMTFTVSDITEFHKVAFKFKENDFALWIDGVEVGTDTSGSTIPSGTLTKLAFSEISTTGGAFRGNTKDLQVYPKALSDAELINLTTI